MANMTQKPINMPHKPDKSTLTFEMGNILEATSELPPITPDLILERDSLSTMKAFKQCIKVWNMQILVSCLIVNYATYDIQYGTLIE